MGMFFKITFNREDNETEGDMERVKVRRKNVFPRDEEIGRDEGSRVR